MEVIPTLLVFLAMTVLTACVSLRDGDDGVCTKQQTVMRSEIVTHQTSYAQRYETCTLFVICKTKYRTAYRSSTRTRYRAVPIDVLICCQGYYQDDDGCKPKVISPLPMIPSSSVSQSPSPTPDHQSAGYSYSDFSYSDLPNDTSTPSIEVMLTSTLPTVVVGVLRLETKMMISGAVIIPVILLLVLIFILIIVSRKRRKQAESPRPSHDAVDGNLGDNHQVGYYTFVPNVEEGQTDGEASIEISNGPKEEFSARPAEKKSKRRKPLQAVFYSKVKKKKANKKELNGQFVMENQEESHYYADMDESPGNVAMGYMDMRGSTSSADMNTPLSYTDMKNGQEHSKMEKIKEGKAEANTEAEDYSEFEPYDKVVPNNNTHTSKDGAYDKLERTDSVLASVPLMVNQNPYDCLGGQDDEACMGENTYAIGGMVDGEGHSNQEMSEYSSPDERLMRNQCDEQNVGNKRRVEEQNESVYYNTPEETARNRRESEQDNIYTNVS